MGAGLDKRVAGRVGGLQMCQKYVEHGVGEVREAFMGGQRVMCHVSCVMLSCSHVPCTHVLIYSCVMYSCVMCHVLMMGNYLGRGFTVLALGPG